MSRVAPHDMFAVRTRPMHDHRSTEETTMIGTLTAGEQIMMAIVVAAVLCPAVPGVGRSKRSGQPGEAE
ncbi:hypothetical protein J7E90_32205 [Streptomyces sp. ISL-111]|nr:hypothetical protein [Streptomyces sp. ISL-111]